MTLGTRGRALTAVPDCGDAASWVAADDLRIMIYTAEPDTEDADRLTFAIVLGTQSFID